MEVIPGCFLEFLWEIVAIPIRANCAEFERFDYCSEGWSKDKSKMEKEIDQLH